MSKLNLSPGPSYIPKDLFEKIMSRDIFLGSDGFTLFEESHRSKEFEYFFENFKKAIKNFLRIPRDFSILIVHGGATNQFSMIADNFGEETKPASYITTGYWSKLAYETANTKTKIIVDFDNTSNRYTQKTVLDLDSLNDKRSYIHYVENETVDGYRLNLIKNIDIPVIVDMSSSLFGKEIDFNNFDVIYSSSSKHLAIAGFSIVLIRNSVLANLNKKIPSILSYKHYHETSSIPCTPPTASIILADQIIKYMMKYDLKYYEDISNKKAAAFYKLISESSIYINNVSQAHRSKFNFIFFINDNKISNKFIEKMSLDFSNFIGHSSKGGFRINSYNLMKIEEFYSVLDAMREFEDSLSLIQK